MEFLTTMETFKELLDFIFADKTESTVGFIGGEPTLHPDFSEMLNIVRMDERIKGITVYTNGLCLDKYIGVLDDEKIHLLINCNDLQYDKLLQSKFQKSLDLSVTRICEFCGELHKDGIKFSPEQKCDFQCMDVYMKISDTNCFKRGKGVYEKLSEKYDSLCKGKNIISMEELA